MTVCSDRGMASRARIVIAVVLIVLGTASTCFWRAAVRDMCRMYKVGEPATNDDLDRQFPALALAMRIHGADLFADRGTWIVIRRGDTITYSESDLLDQLLRPRQASMIAVGIGLLLLPDWRRKRRHRRVLITYGVVIALFTGLSIADLAVFCYVRATSERWYEPHPVSPPDELSHGAPDVAGQ